MKKTIIAAICAATMSLTANAAAFTDVKSYGLVLTVRRVCRIERLV